MEILLPRGTEIPLERLLAEMAVKKPFLPFDKVAMEFVQAVSRDILTRRECRSYPELMAMAHWMRGAHLQKIQAEYDADRRGRIWLPRGLVLHFAPANVDTIFIYSWFLSLLLGNLNVIRITQRRGAQIALLLDVLHETLGNDAFRGIACRNLLISYEHDGAMTRMLSDHCRVRVIWGGDETVRAIRSIPLPPDAKEIVFADKFSLAALNARTIVETDDAALAALARNFYNDTFWFDQLACSSPRLVAWIGEEPDVEQAKAKFWAHLEDVIHEKIPAWGSEVGVTRMVTGYSLAAQGLADKLTTVGTDTCYRVHVPRLTDALREQHCGGGFFLEMELASLDELSGQLGAKDQTVAVYGFTGDDLRRFAWQLAGQGVDRIVPVGGALTFQLVWDGYDLPVYLTREVLL